MARSLQLDIPLLLPDVVDASDACIGRLIAELDGRPGIEQVHVLAAKNGSAAQLCIHHDPDVLTLPRIREIVQAAGARISARFAHVIWSVEGIGHPRRARTVAARLRELPGVIEAEANAAGLVRIEFDREQGSEQTLREALAAMGVTARAATVVAPPSRAKPRHGHEHEHEHMHH